MASEVIEIAENLTKEAIDLATENFVQEVQPSAEEVRAAANELIQYTKQLEIANKAHAVGKTVAMRSNNIETVYGFTKQMIKDKQDFKELMQKVFNFQNIANAFLGQKVQMTFVYISPSSGKVNLYALENNIEDLTVDRASKSHGGTITGRYTNGQIKKFGQQIINSKYDSLSLEKTFEDVYQRFKISKEKLKLGGAAIILWKISKWDGVWISGAGPLGEAYLSFFINEYKFTNGKEQNVKDYMMNNKYGAYLADNASGFLQGDVTKGSIEYGVKIKGATALGYMDIINYAKGVLESADVKTYLTNLKTELSEKGSQNMVKPLEGCIDKEIMNQLKPFYNLTK